MLHGWIIGKRLLEKIHIFALHQGCIKTDLVGAHVQKAYSIDQKWYIVPLCSSCNQRTDTFEVYETLVPVPSNL